MGAGPFAIFGYSLKEVGVHVDGIIHGGDRVGSHRCKTGRAEGGSLFGGRCGGTEDGGEGSKHSGAPAADKFVAMGEVP